MEKKLIYESAYEISVYKAKINKGYLLAHDLLYHLDTLEINSLSEISEFKTLLKNPVGYLISKLPETSTKFFGVEVSPEKVFSLLDLNYQTILNMLTPVNVEKINLFLEVGCLDENGFLQISDELLEAATDKFRIYVESDEEIQFWENYLKVIEGINNLIRLGVPPSTFTTQTRNWLVKKQNSRYFEPTHRFFLKH